MKVLHAILASFAASLAWLYAVVDWLAQGVTVSHRSRLIPGRVFPAVYRASRDYLEGRPFVLDTHGLRRADFQPNDPWTGKPV
jgi:hypothetical protein